MDEHMVGQGLHTTGHIYYRKYCSGHYTHYQAITFTWRAQHKHHYARWDVCMSGLIHGQPYGSL